MDISPSVTVMKKTRNLWNYSAFSTHVIVNILI